MYNKYTIEHNELEREIDELKYAWKDIEEDVLDSRTVKELETLIECTPLYRIYQSLISDFPICYFESMWEVICAFKRDVEYEIAELESYCY